MREREKLCDEEKEEEPQRTVASERNRERWKIERGTYRERERESEKEGERGEVAIGGGGEEIHRTDTSLAMLYAARLPCFTSTPSFSLSPVPLSISLSHFLFLSSTRPSSFLRVSVSFSLSPSLARHAALVRSHSRSPLCCLWSPGSSLLALVRSILHERER